MRETAMISKVTGKLSVISFLIWPDVIIYTLLSVTNYHRLYSLSPDWADTSNHSTGFVIVR